MLYSTLDKLKSRKTSDGTVMAEKRRRQQARSFDGAL